MNRRQFARMGMAPWVFVVASMLLSPTFSIYAATPGNAEADHGTTVLAGPPPGTQGVTRGSSLPEPWVTVSPSPTAVSRSAAAIVDGLLYVVGGETTGGVRLGEVQIYDPETDLWDNVSAPAMPIPVSNLCAAVIGDSILVPGGYTGTVVETTLQVFDTVANTWDTVASDPLPAPRFAPACASHDGRLYVFGGWNGAEAVDTAWVYDPAAGAGTRWTVLPAAPSSGAYGAALSVNGLIFYGGLSDNFAGDFAGVAAYDPVANDWTLYPPLQTARGGAGMWATGDTLYIGGGGWASFLTTLEAYDTTQGAGGSWAFTNPLNQGRRTFGYATDEVNGRLYATTGWAGAFLAHTETNDFVSVYEVTAVVASGDGTITPATQDVIEGDDADFTVIPQTGWSIGSVSGDTCDPQPAGGDQWQAANITDDCAVEAVFLIDSYAVTATVADGNGTITPPAQDVDHGDDATFTVIPQTGWSIGSVSGDTCDPQPVGGDQWQAANITEDCAVEAVFLIDSYPVSATVAGGNGTITPPAQQVDHGDDATFTVTPDAGWSVAAVTGDTCNPVNTGGVTWMAENITAACAVEASFILGELTVGGTVTGLQANGLVLDLNNIELLPITADGPFTFAAEFVDGSPYAVTISDQPAGQVCTLTNGTGTFTGADVSDIEVTCVSIEIMLEFSIVDFGNLPLGDTGFRTLTITNPGTLDLVIQGFGEPAAPFSFFPGSCGPLPLSLAPGESCEVEVQLDGGAPGQFSDFLVIDSSAISSPDSVELRGTVTGAASSIPTLGWQSILFVILMMSALGAAVLLRRAA